MKLFWVSAALLSVVAVGAVFCVDYLPTNDGPQHVFMGFAARHLDDASRGYARYLERSFPVSSLGFDAVYGAALRFLPWRPALRVALTVSVLVWAWGVVALAGALQPARRWLGLIGFAAAFQWSLYMGFFSFHLATGLGFGIAAFAVWRRTWTPRERALLAGMLVLEAVAHAFAAAVTGVFLGALALSRSPARRRLHALGWMCLMALPAASVAWLSHAKGDGSQLQMDGAGSWSARLGMVTSCFVGGPAWRSWPMVALAMAGAAAFILSANARRDPDQRALFFTGALSCAVAALAPLHLHSWNFFAPRFAPCALIYLALLLPTESYKSRRLRRALPGGARAREGMETLPGFPYKRSGSAIALVAFALASLSWAWNYHRDLRQRSDDALSGLDVPIVRSSPRLPLILDPLQGEPFDPWARTMPFVVSSLSVDMLYVTEQGGVSPSQFTSIPTLHPVVWRKRPEVAFPPSPPKDVSHLLMNPTFDPGRRIALLNYVASYAPGFEDMLLLGDPADTAVILQRGFQVDWAKGRFTIARFHGCPLRLVFSGAEQATHAILVQAGWYPASRATFSTVIELAQTRGGPPAMPIAQAPCGKVWLQVAEDLNDDRQVNPGDRLCGQAAKDGRFVVEVDPTHGEIHCQLVDADPAVRSEEHR